MIENKFVVALNSRFMQKSQLSNINLFYDKNVDKKACRKKELYKQM